MKVTKVRVLIEAIISNNFQGWSVSLVTMLTRLSTRTLTTRADFYRRIQGSLSDIERAGTLKPERVITSPQSGDIKVGAKQVVNFCANNYLGLCNDASIKETSKKAIDEYGAGLGSVRFICGTQDLHKRLEEKISKFHETQDTILYSSCFDANAGVFEALFGENDLIISDSLNHASIIDGIRLCKAARKRYNHDDMALLEEILRSSADITGSKLIVTDGVFSMDGDIAKLDKICELADKYEALVFVDDCHATGFVGPTGRGSPELFGLQRHIDILNSTLGKALGGASGGYTTGKHELVALLRQKSRPYLFSNTLAPSVAASALQALEIVDARPELRDTLKANIRRFRDGMAQNGFKLLGNPLHPIAPVMIGDAALAAKLADELLEEGIYVIGFSYPVVPKSLARIRVQISAAHTTQQIDKAIEAFTKLGKLHGLLKA